jgi:hypothetical protein
MVAQATGCRPKFIVAGRLAVAADLLSGALQPTPRGTAAYRTLRERHCSLLSFAVLPSKPRGCSVFCLRSWYLGVEENDHNSGTEGVDFKELDP